MHVDHRVVARAGVPLLVVVVVVVVVLIRTLHLRHPRLRRLPRQLRLRSRGPRPKAPSPRTLRGPLPRPRVHVVRERDDDDGDVVRDAAFKLFPPLARHLHQRLRRVVRGVALARPLHRLLVRDKLPQPVARDDEEPIVLTERVRARVRLGDDADGGRHGVAQRSAHRQSRGHLVLDPHAVRSDVHAAVLKLHDAPARALDPRALLRVVGFVIRRQRHRLDGFLVVDPSPEDRARVPRPRGRELVVS
eukprot:31476-Pelagococcus_subviridis.AAC.4